MNLTQFLDFLRNLKEVCKDDPALYAEARQIELEFKKRLILTNSDVEKKLWGEYDLEKDIFVPNSKNVFSDKDIEAIRNRLKIVLQEAKKKNKTVNARSALAYLRQKNNLRTEIMLAISNYRPQKPVSDLEIRSDIKEYINENLLDDAKKIVGLLKQSEDPIQRKTAGEIIHLVNQLFANLPFQVSDGDRKMDILIYVFNLANVPNTDFTFLKKLNQLQELIQQRSYQRQREIEDQQRSDRKLGENEDLPQEDIQIVTKKHLASQEYKDNESFSALNPVLQAPIQRYFTRNGAVAGLLELAQIIKAANKNNLEIMIEVENAIKAIKDIESPETYDLLLHLKKNEEKIKELEKTLIELDQLIKNPDASETQIQKAMDLKQKISGLQESLRTELKEKLEKLNSPLSKKKKFTYDDFLDEKLTKIMSIFAKLMELSPNKDVYQFSDDLIGVFRSHMELEKLYAEVMKKGEKKSEEKIPKKIAYVQIASLINNGFLNLVLLQKLKEYDQIVLLSEDSKANVFEKIGKALKESNSYLTISQIIDALRIKGITNVTLTDQGNSLSQFEDRAYQYWLEKKKLSPNMDQENEILRGKREELLREAEKKRKVFGSLIVEEYKNLHSSHQHIYGDDIEITYFADAAILRDLTESISIKDLPRALVVKGSSTPSPLIPTTRFSTMFYPESLGEIPVYTQIVAFFTALRKQATEDFQKNIKNWSTTQIREIVNNIENIISELLKENHPTKWTNIAELIGRLPSDLTITDPNINLSTLADAFAGLDGDSSMHRFVKIAKLESSSLDKAELSDIQRLTIGRLYERYYLPDATRTLQNLFTAISKADLADQGEIHSLSEKFREFGEIKAKLKRAGFFDNVRPLQDNALTDVFTGFEFTAYDFYQMRGLGNRLEEMRSASEKRLNGTDEQIKTLTAEMDGLTQKIHKAYKVLDDLNDRTAKSPAEEKLIENRKASLLNIISILKQKQIDLANKLEELQDARNKQINETTFYANFGLLVRDGAYKVENNALTKQAKNAGCKTEQEIIEFGKFNNGYKILEQEYMQILTTQVKIADIPQTVKSVFLYDNERNNFNLSFYKYQLDHMAEIFKAQAKLMMGDREARFQSLKAEYIREDVAKEQKLAKTNPYFAKHLKQDPKREEKRIQEATLRAKADLHAEALKNREIICQQFILNIIELIKTTEWKFSERFGAKFSKRFGGTSRPGVPRRLPGNVAEIYDICIEARDGKKEWHQAFVELAYHGKYASEHKPFTLFGIGARQQVTQDFYDKFKALFGEAKKGTEEAVANRDVPAIPPKK